MTAVALMYRSQVQRMEHWTRLRSNSSPPKIKKTELGTLCFDLLVKKNNKAISPINETDFKLFVAHRRSSLCFSVEVLRDSPLPDEHHNGPTRLAAPGRLIIKVNLNLCFNPGGLTVNPELSSH